MNKYAGKKVKITKIGDPRFNNNHPNGINIGFTFEGELIRYVVDHSLIAQNPKSWFSTSLVTKIEEDNNHDIIYTKNSIYKIETIEDESKS